VALWAGRPDEAIEALRRLNPESQFVREWILYWSVLSSSQHLLGDETGELETTRRGRELHPGSLLMAQRRGAALIALGRLEELERLSQESLALRTEGRLSLSSVLLSWGAEMRWHGRVEPSRVFVQRALDWLDARPEEEKRTEAYRASLGEALLLRERDAEAEAVFSRLAAEQPEKVGYRARLGVIAAGKGDRERALQASKWLRGLSRPYLFGDQIRYAAAIAARLGEREQAVALLREALAQGVNASELHADGLLLPLWDYAPFRELVKPKG
jgi:tetratricopeptide (TPR) repeat protein